MKKRTGIFTYDTISEFLTAMGFPKQQENDFTISSLEGYHGDKSFDSPFFRTNYFTFLLITEGTGAYTIDEKTFVLEPITFYFTNPGHIKSFSIVVPWKGFIMSLSEAFIRKYDSRNFFAEFPFLIAETTPAMRLSDDTKQDLHQRFQAILAEYQGNSEYKYQIISNYVIGFLYRLKEIIRQSNEIDTDGLNYSNSVILFRKLLDDKIARLLEKGKEEQLSLSDFASKLHLHPTYLGNLVKNETGKTVNQWVTERIIAEARSMLRNTSLSVAEVSYRLGFDEPTNFTKFFKKSCGQTPKQFRLE